jgi:hypothetical protein
LRDTHGADTREKNFRHERLIVLDDVERALRAPVRMSPLKRSLVRMIGLSSVFAASMRRIRKQASIVELARSCEAEKRRATETG